MSSTLPRVTLYASEDHWIMETTASWTRWGNFASLFVNLLIAMNDVRKSLLNSLAMSSKSRLWSWNEENWKDAGETQNLFFFQKIYIFSFLPMAAQKCISINFVSVFIVVLGNISCFSYSLLPPVDERNRNRKLDKYLRRERNENALVIFQIVYFSFIVTLMGKEDLKLKRSS